MRVAYFVFAVLFFAPFLNLATASAVAIDPLEPLFRAVEPGMTIAAVETQAKEFGAELRLSVTGGWLYGAWRGQNPFEPEQHLYSNIFIMLEGGRVACTDYYFFAEERILYQHRKGGFFCPFFDREKPKNTP